MKSILLLLFSVVFLLCACGDENNVNMIDTESEAAETTTALETEEPFDFENIDYTAIKDSRT